MDRYKLLVDELLRKKKKYARRDVEEFRGVQVRRKYIWRFWYFTEYREDDLGVFFA